MPEPGEPYRPLIALSCQILELFPQFSTCANFFLPASTHQELCSRQQLPFQTPPLTSEKQTIDNYTRSFPRYCRNPNRNKHDLFNCYKEMLLTELTLKTRVPTRPTITFFWRG